MRKLRVYNFVSTKSWRVLEVKAVNLAQAWKKTEEWYRDVCVLHGFIENYGFLTSNYYTALDGDFCMDRITRTPPQWLAKKVEEFRKEAELIFKFQGSK